MPEISNLKTELTNCQLETIIETDMGVELTIQDTSELQEAI